MAPELKLGVGLDLAYFRQQMRKAVNIAQSEFTAQLNVKINRQALQRETEYLTRYFRRKNYRISLETNLSAEIAKANSLIKKLNQLKTGSTVPSVSTSARTSTTPQAQAQAQRTFAQELRTLDKTALQKIYKAAAEDALLSFEEGIANNKGKIVTALNQAAQEASAGFIAALQNEKSELFKAAGEYGNSLLNGLKKTLKIASPSKEMFDIGDDAGKGFELGLIQSMEAAERTATRRMRRMLDRLARMVLMMGGMSGAEISSQIAQARALPSVDFPSTVPPARGVPIGPSATGRALTGVTQNALPGGSRFAAKYLPTDLGDELKRILRGAAYAFVDSLSQRVRQVSVREIGQAQLAPSRIAGLLPSAVGRPSAIYGGAGDAVSRRIAQAQARSAERAARIMAEGPQGFALGAGGSGPAGPFRPFAQPPRGGAIVPYNAAMAGGPSTQLPPGYFAGGKLQQALKGADQYLKQSRVPLTGAIQELGSEFGNAVKQVLLFGTAYKALAFIINLPNQALAAATSLQTFNNQLLAVTGSAGAANQAFSFVDGLAERFNVPLESARQGFVRLYASMEPAGFAPDQIEGLFTGISKAAATFGLSADQVDRVTYAFSQMASKGQAMSEELKGQLGDVLPGSLALFARAAQMSIPEFTKALEDGAFKGEAFQALLRNVAKLMNTEFAGGAAGAADTLQGRMNDLSNSVTKMYESFEPLVGLISAQVFPQLSGIIGDATEAIQAFVAGIQGAEDPAAQLSSRGLAIYEALRQVADIGQSLQGIISALAPTFGALGQMILGTVQAIAQLLNTKAGQWLAKFALQVAAATAALQLMARVGLFNAVAGLIRFVTNIRGSIAALKVMITTTRIAKIALGGLFAAGIMIGLEALAGKLTNVGSAARDAAAETRRLRDELDAAAAAGDVEAVGREYLEANTALAAARKERDRATEARREAETVPPDPLGLSAARLAGAKQAEQRAQERVNEAIRTVDAARRARDIAAQRRLDQQQQQGGLEAIDLSGETEKDAGKTKKSAKALKERVDMSNEELALRQKIRQQEAGIEQGLDHYNKLKLIQLNLELELLRVRESDMLMNEKYNAMQEAQRKADSERAKIFIDLGEATKDQMEENQRMSVEYKDILLESQYAAGLITQSEYEQNKALSQRLGLVRRIQEMQNVGAITPSQATTAIGTIQAAPLPGTFEAYAASLKREFDNLTSPINQLKTAIDGIGSAFEDAFSSAITGATSAQESLSQFFGNVGKMFADMAARMLSQWLVMKAVGLVGSLFGGGSTMGGSGYFDPKTGLGIAGPNFGLANGGVINGHFMPVKAFATGGVVNGPTLGLVGEGRFNEAVVPLPDGKSIPVELGGDGRNIVSNITVNVSNGQARSEGNTSGNDLGRKLEGAVKQVIIEELRPGGVLAGKR